MNGQAQRIPLARHLWLPILILTFFMGVGSYGIWAITWPAIKAIRLGQPLPADWTWTSVIGFDVVLIGLYGYMCWKVLAQWLTFFTSEGVGQPRIWRSAFIRWLDVTSVTRKLNTIQIKTSNQTIEVAYGQFKNRD